MSDAPHRAFVAGATGYTGRGVVRALRARGIPTFAHARPGSSSLAACQADFEALGATVDPTPWDAEAMAATLARIQPTLVFALLGTTRGRAASEGLGAEEAYERIDYGLTALLIKAALTAAPGARFVYLSSLGAAADTRNAYLRARGKVEAELQASGAAYTIARPSFISGEDRGERRVGERVGAVLTDGALSLAGALGARRLKARFSSMTGDELGAALVRAALDAGCAGRILDAADLRDPA